MLQLDPCMIVDGLHVGDRVLDLKKHPLYPVGVVLEIRRKPVQGGLGVGAQHVFINVVFDGSDIVETYPLSVFGYTLIFVSTKWKPKFLDFEISITSLFLSFAFLF